MYKLLKIDERMMDRDVLLQNTKTGTLDVCFDYSIGFSDDNFDFMEIGNEYECKILLMGDVFPNNAPNLVPCTVVNGDIQFIGNEEVIHVRIYDDDYYILNPKIVLKKDAIIFLYCFRKDLIQVDTKIHPNFID